MNTPWGVSQGQSTVAKGIVSVWTASHGGYRLSPEREAQVPEYMRKDGWYEYEEDCNWVIPCLVFPDEFRAYYDRENEKGAGDSALEDAKATLQHWMPEMYEQFFGVVLLPGESMLRDEFIAKMNHRSDFMVVSAYGDHDVRVPDGFVGTFAKREQPEAEEYFLIPKEEYRARDKVRGRNPFVIDEKYHKVWVDHI